jgi:hypothetical protein
MKMSVIDHARYRIVTVIEEIRRLRECEFPYIQPRDALEVLERMFSRQQSVLEKIPEKASTDVKNNACSTSLDLLSVYVPILGFILRSTNVRNAFEMYAPLLRLAQSILRPTSKLIVSSEWEFSPYVYTSITDLPGFVLIGLPATESSNPLLVPLAGHELGHSVWETEGFYKIFEKKIEDRVLDELMTNKWKDYSAIYPQHKKENIENANPSLMP